MFLLLRFIARRVLELFHRLEAALRRGPVGRALKLAPPSERAVGPFAKIRRWLRTNYMTVDPRTAGIFRLALGFLLVLDTIRHAGEARLLYSNSGVLTNDWHLYQPTSGYEFSIFHAFSTLGEVKICFALGILSHLLLFAGYRSRLFAFTSFVFMTSMDSRIPFVENGGYIVVNLACLWAVLLPVGQRYSIDAWLKSWRARRETTADELNDRSDYAGERKPFVSLAGLIVVVNIAAIYFWNVINKSGDVWRRGDSIHYVLYLNRMITGLAVLSRDLLPEGPLLRVVDWSVLCVEAMLAVLIISPKAKRYTRPMAMAGMTLLHATFGLMMRLGPFSWFLIGCSTLLLSPIQFADLERWYAKRAPRWQVGVDRSSPAALDIARVLARLDGFERLTFVPRDTKALISIRKDDDAEWTGEPGTVARGLAHALPLGKYLYPIVQLVTLGAPARVLAFVGARREGVARFFGIGSSGPAAKEETPLAATLLTEARLGREAFLVFYAIASIMQSYMENKAIPQFLKFEEPAVVQATITYPRLFQGWGMFAPNPIQEDGILVIDAYTIDGRRFDPFNGGEPLFDLTKAHGLGISQLRQDYGNRIRLDHNQLYRDGMRNWLSEWHQMTGNPNDEIVAFDVYWLRDKCPPVGKREPTDNDPVPLFSWRKPGYRRPPGMPPIPPAPRARSAENWDGVPKPAAKR